MSTANATLRFSYTPVDTSIRTMHGHLSVEVRLPSRLSYWPDLTARAARQGSHKRRTWAA